MKVKHFSALLIPFLLFAFFLGCEDDNKGTNSSNTLPEITSLTANPPSGQVDLEQTSTLIVTATDADGDQLTHYWDASSGNFDVITGDTVVWIAPDEASQAEIIVWASDGVDQTSEVYSFDFSSFAPGPPTLDSIHATPAHIYRGTVANSDQWFMELYAKISGTDGTGIVRVTAELPSGSILNLRDDGVSPDIIANDNIFQSFPGGYTLTVDTGWVNFTAINSYYEEVSDSFLVDVLCDLIPNVIPDSTFDSQQSIYVPLIDGDTYEYETGIPLFRWLTYPGAENYEIWLTYINYIPIWMPNTQLTDTTAAYNYDNTAAFIQLELNTDYILHLRVNKGNAWAKRELQIRRTQ